MQSRVDPIGKLKMNELPNIVRVRHELRRRKLTVARVERLPPQSVRVVLKGSELEGFTSLGFDDHVKLFFPTPDDGVTADAGAHAPRSLADAAVMRDFTPRRYDAAAGELWVDFFLHEGGPAASWAAQATVGQTLVVGGPKGSAILAPDGIDGHVLVGDETALPAIGRRLDELSPDTRTLVVVETDVNAARPVFPSRPALDVIWVARDRAADSPARQIIDTLRGVSLPPGRCFVWVALESQSARAVRNYLRDERGVHRKWIKAAGYWQRGAAGMHDGISEDA
jgi:NADPH-dependent ferric siderophore reductase